MLRETWETPKSWIFGDSEPHTVKPRSEFLMTVREGSGDYDLSRKNRAIWRMLGTLQANVPTVCLCFMADTTQADAALFWPQLKNTSLNNFRLRKPKEKYRCTKWSNRWHVFRVLFWEPTPCNESKFRMWRSVRKLYPHFSDRRAVIIRDLQTARMYLEIVELWNRNSFLQRFDLRCGTHKGHAEHVIFLSQKSSNGCFGI